jgi:hypothetical protein
MPFAGLQVGGLGDLLAMKLNAIAGRAQLRDYFDVMTIEQKGGRSVEEGLALFLVRYRPEHTDSALRPIVLGLAYLDDVADDRSCRSGATRSPITGAAVSPRSSPPSSASVSPAHLELRHARPALCSCA